MKRHLKSLFATIALISILGNAYAQQHKVVSNYSNEGQISAPLSVTLTNGFYAPAGSNLRIFTTGASYTDCQPLVSAPSNNQNYILTRTFREAGVTEQTLSNPRNVCAENQTIQYFDGLGRNLQTVQVQASPGFNDIIQPVAYDAFGREAVKYQPYSIGGNSGAYRGSALAEQLSFYNSQPAISGISNTPSPFAQTLFEPSPLNRMVQQGAPGDAWQPASGHTAKMEYGSNNGSSNYAVDGFSVRLYQAIPVATAGEEYKRTLSSTGFYEPGELYLNISKDENWQASDGKAGTLEEYKDKEGHIVLKRSFNFKAGTGIETLSTYYVYDDLDNLSFVLPPGTAPDQGNIDQTALDLYGYQYRYDGRKRLIEKKIPGKGWEFMVYNKLDQVTHTQDANQRAASQWSWTKYDAFGRIVLTGVENNQGIDRAGMQNYNDGITPQWEERSAANPEGYTRNTHPSAGEDNANIVFHTINYYDDYDFPGNGFGQPTGNQANSGRTRSLLTGTRVRTLGTAQMLLSVNYYDGIAIEN